jgi:hypothetical protein
MTLYPEAQYVYVPHIQTNTHVAQAAITSGHAFDEQFPSHYNNSPEEFPAPKVSEHSTRNCVAEQYTEIFRQEPFVSPVTYDPKTGLYNQTFPEEHTEFLRKYGRRIEIPESCDSEWSYSDAQFATGQSEQQNGCYYNPGSYQAPSEPLDTSISSPMDDGDCTSMMQHITSSTPTPAHIHRPYVDNTIAPTDFYGAMAIPDV